MEKKTFVVIGPPAFASPDPETMKNSMFLGTQPRKVVDVGSSPASDTPAADKKAGEWIEEVDATTNQDELDAVGQEYAESGANFKTVADAIEKKQAELDADSGDDK